jgi:hypothetical protein
MQDSHLSHSGELAEITHSVIIIIGSSVQYPCGWNSVLSKSDNSCKCLPLLIQHPEHLRYFLMICCCEIKPSPAHIGRSYEHRGYCRILEFQLHFCALIIARFCIDVEIIRKIRNKLWEPPHLMTNLVWQKTK